MVYSHNGIYTKALHKGNEMNKIIAIHHIMDKSHKYADRKRQTEKEYIVQNPLCKKVSLKIINLDSLLRSPNNSSIC